MTSWYCGSFCKISQGGAGPWDDDNEYFPKIRQAHKGCPGFQTGEPKLKGKANWENTEIEKEATKIFNQNIDRWLHELITDLKGPSKICLIKDNGRRVNKK